MCPAHSTVSEFIIKAKNIHNYEYDYSLVEYNNSKTKIKIICGIHGIFEQTPNNHLRGAGCPKCGNQKIAKSKMKGIDLFIKQATAVHGNSYDYSKSIYKNVNTNIEIICFIHGSFWQCPSSHINNKSGCPQCGFLRMSAKKINKSKGEFIEKATKLHNGKYNYDKSFYKEGGINIIITCKLHGDFLQTPRSHLSGAGCRKCMYEYIAKCGTFTSEEFIIKSQKIHGNKYDYSNVNYIGIYSPIIIGCGIHGPFSQKPTHHLRGHGCHKCSKIISKPEIAWLNSLGIDEQFRHITIKIEGRQIKTDAFVPSTNTIYEFYGDFWHGNPQIYKLEDVNEANKKTFNQLYKQTLDREKFILEHGYKLITIWENDWKQSII